jgi:uncharacterized protein YdhG (YjbR/CyaY superfamily)
MMRGSDFSTPQNSDDYIAQQPAEFRATLEEMRSIILATVPLVTESISYQIPCYKYLYMLVGIGVNKKYCSFYVMSPGLVKTMKDELKDVKVSGSTLHFKPNEMLPVDLIRKIILTRASQNEILAQSKKINK